MLRNISPAVPGLAGSPTKAAERIIHLLEESRAVTHMHTYEHFRRTLGIWQVALEQVKMGPWLEACAGMEKGLGPLQHALGLLMAEAMHAYDDVLGSVYMLLSQGEKRLGQYFTPYPVAKMIAEINLSDLKPREPGSPPIRLLEPCCGSGVMILAAAETIETRYPGMILRGDVLFYGVDLDPLCVTMCTINMLLHGIGHVAHVSNDHTEKEQTDDAARSPQFVFQSAKIAQGNSLTQDTAEILREVTPWIPVNLVLPPAVTEERPTKEARADGAPQSSEEVEVRATPNGIEATKQSPVGGGGMVQITSVEDVPKTCCPQVEPTEPKVVLVGAPEFKEDSRRDAGGERQVVDFVHETSGAQEWEKSASEPPASLQAFDAPSPRESTLAQEELVIEAGSEKESLISTDSGKASTSQKPEQTWQHASLSQNNRRQRRSKAGTDVVQQDLFSLFP